MCSALILALSISVTVRAQEAADWQYSRENDALHGKVSDKFVLIGKYLTPPEHAHDPMPSLVVVCENSKVKENYLNVGAVVTKKPGSSDLFFGALEARMDGKKKRILATSESTDGKAVFFSRVDLGDMLGAQRVIVGVDEFLGPEIVMQFNMPDSSSVLAACGKDRILKHDFQKENHRQH